MDFDNDRVAWVETSPTNKTITTNLSLSVYHTMDIFDAVMIPTVVIFGLIGNLLSVFVFGTTKLSHLPSSAYLTALSVSDGLSLLNLLLVSIPDRQSPIHVPVLCNLIVYSINVCGMISSWLVVVFTVERFVVIQYPLHKLAKCSSRKARRLICMVVPIPCLWFVYTFVIAGIDPDSERCTVLMQYHVEATIFHMIDIIIVYLIPACVVTVLNVKIARVLVRCQRQRSQMQNGIMKSTISSVKTVSRQVHGGSRQSTNVAEYTAVAGDDFATRKNRDNCYSEQESRVLLMTPRNDKPQSCDALSKQTQISENEMEKSSCTEDFTTASRDVHGRSRRSTKVASYMSVANENATTQGTTTAQKKVSVTTPNSKGSVYGRGNDLAITRTLIVTSTAFAVLNLPHNTIQLIRSIVPLFGELLVDDFFHVLSTLSNDLYYLNFAINVLVYHLTSSNYRNGAKKVLCKLLKCRIFSFCFCRKRSLRERSWRRRHKGQLGVTTNVPPTAVRFTTASTTVVSNGGERKSLQFKPLIKYPRKDRRITT